MPERHRVGIISAASRKPIAITLQKAVLLNSWPTNLVSAKTKHSIHICTWVLWYIHGMRERNRKRSERFKTKHALEKEEEKGVLGEALACWFVRRSTAVMSPTPSERSKVLSSATT